MIHKEEVVTFYSDVTSKEVTKVAPIRIKKGNRTYVIDVDADNVDGELAQISVADAITKGRVETARRSSARSDRAKLHAKVRKWASDNDIEVGARGSVPDSIVEQYYAAQRAGAEAAVAAEANDNDDSDVADNDDNDNEDGDDEDNPTHRPEFSEFYNNGE